MNYPRRDDDGNPLVTESELFVYKGESRRQCGGERMYILSEGVTMSVRV
jgi:hypothetical protein